MTSRTVPHHSTRTAALCGSGPSVERLQKSAIGYEGLAVKLADDIRPVLTSRSEDYCGIIITLELALLLLRPLESGVSLPPQTPVLVLLQGESLDNEIGQHLLRRGVAGFLSDGCGIEVVERAIQRTSEGELWASRSLLSLAFKQAVIDNGLHRLTTREQEIVGWVVEGATNQQIAERLFVTRETVRWHLRAVYSKLGVHNRNAVVEFMNGAQKADEI